MLVPASATAAHSASRCSAEAWRRAYRSSSDGARRVAVVPRERREERVRVPRERRERRLEGRAADVELDGGCRGGQGRRRRRGDGRGREAGLDLGDRGRRRKLRGRDCAGRQRRALDGRWHADKRLRRADYLYLVDVELVCRMVFEHADEASRRGARQLRCERDGPAVPIAEPELVARPRLTEDRVGDRLDFSDLQHGTVAVRELGRHERLDSVARESCHRSAAVCYVYCTVFLRVCAAGVRAIVAARYGPSRDFGARGAALRTGTGRLQRIDVWIAVQRTLIDYAV